MNAIDVVNVTSSVKHNHGKLYLDSGAQRNSHSPDVTQTSDPKPVFAGTAISGFTGSSKKVEITKRMYPSLVGEEVDIVIRSYCVPNSNINLLSMGALLEEGCEIHANQQGATASLNGDIFMYAKLVDRLLELQHEVLTELTEKIRQHAGHISNFDTGTLKIPHDTVGRWGFDSVRKMFNFPPKSLDCLDPVCQSCLVKDKKIRLGALTEASRKGFRICSDVSAKWPRIKVAESGTDQEGVQILIMNADPEDSEETISSGDSEDSDDGGVVENDDHPHPQEVIEKNEKTGGRC